MAERKSNRDAALGAKPADVVLKHCRLVNVLSGEIEENVDIAISGGEIVGVGQDYAGAHEVDVAGRYVYPGLIDAHIHLESTKLTIPEAGRLMARFGTAAVITDPHEIANVSGLEGVSFQMDTARDCGFIDVFFTVPSCVPTMNDDAVETCASDLGPDKLRMLQGCKNVVGLGELMNVPGILNGDMAVERKLADFGERGVLDGHAPMLSGKQLNACIYMGIQSDHESTTADEAREKLRRGMVLMIREGSSEHNLDALLPVVNSRNSGRVMFASDDLDPSDMMRRGHINHLVKRAVAKGIDPIVALQMATINPANYFGLSRRMGAIFAGADANLVVSRDLENFEPDFVIHRGQVVYKNGQTLNVNRPGKHHLRPTMHCALPAVGALQIRMEVPKQAHLIDLVPGQIVTRSSMFMPKQQNGCAVADAAQGIAKVCVFDRHMGSGGFGKGFVRGFGMKYGAIGSSVGHDSHNLIIVGMSDAAMLRCAHVICEMGGGQAAVLGDDSGEIVRLPLPIAGLISNDAYENVIAQEQKLEDFCRQALGVTLPRPFAAMSFLALPVIPAIRITDKGLFVVDPGAYPRKVSIFED